MTDPPPIPCDYGGVGAARAVEQLRLIHVELQMAPMRTGVRTGGAGSLGLRRSDSANH